MTYLRQRLGGQGIALIVLLVTAAVLATGLTVVVAGELIAASADSVTVAPFRWAQRC